LLRSPLVTALLFAAVLLLAASGVRAELPSQRTLPPEQQADEFLKGLAPRVALTPEEHAAVRPILVEQLKRRQDIVRARLAINPGVAGMQALREDLRGIARETETRLAAVLPPAKMAAVRAYWEERRQQALQSLGKARADG
jgi:hypothetical protein